MCPIDDDELVASCVAAFALVVRFEQGNRNRRMVVVCNRTCAAPPLGRDWFPTEAL